VLLNPGAHLFETFVGIGAEAGGVDLIELFVHLFAPYLALPGGRENAVNLVVEILLLERLPFIAVKPDTATAGAVINEEIQPVADTVLQENAPTVGAELGILYILDVKFDFEKWFFGKGFAVGIEPRGVVGVRDPMPPAVVACGCVEAILECCAATGSALFAYWAFHDSAPFDDSTCSLVSRVRLWDCLGCCKCRLDLRTYSFLDDPSRHLACLVSIMPHVRSVEC
jgi:hypothetical protein